MYQVNKHFSVFINSLFRNYCHTPSTHILYPLKSRCLLKISGKEAPLFLQGLITNDMNHFQEGAKSLYALFLNNKGRVLYDTIIHKWEGLDSYLLECDHSVCNSVLKHFAMYRLRRKIEISNVSNDFCLYALIAAANSDVDTKTSPRKKVNIYKDPRLTDLGHRVIASTEADENYIKNVVGEDSVISINDDNYKYLRYKLGVCEGPEELPPGTCLPLEINCDYLHGVSFHKGCYIGQELTARVYHTGVIRKRIMPLRFLDDVEEDIEMDCDITTDGEKKKKIGKFKAFINDYGVGILKVKEALEAKNLKVDDYSVEPVKPHWWPKEAPKEKLTNKVV